jgi:hypothetical protein
MKKKNFKVQWWGLILILFALPFTTCKQASEMEEGLLTMEGKNVKSNSQIPTNTTVLHDYIGKISSACGYIPSPIADVPDEAVYTLTPFMYWTTVKNATTYSYKLYEKASIGIVYTKVYESPNLPAQNAQEQFSQLPSGILHYGKVYKWMVRARIGACASEYSIYANFDCIKP